MLVYYGAGRACHAKLRFIEEFRRADPLIFFFLPFPSLSLSLSLPLSLSLVPRGFRAYLLLLLLLLLLPVQFAFSPDYRTPIDALK
jgi:hypothetical protein